MNAKSSLLTFGFALFISLINGQSFIQQKQLDQYLQSVFEASPVPGFSVVVVSGESVVFSKGYGLEKAGTSKSMTPRTCTAIGSLGKSLTAMAMLQLVEQGKVDLDAPVTTYLPEFRTANPRLSDRITVRMLLNNSSGLYGGVSRRWSDPSTAMEHFVASLESFYLKKMPGTSYEYANTGFSVAGLIISRISGMSYPEYLDQYIFSPLEMQRSTTDPERFEEMQVLYGHYAGIDRALPAEPGLESAEMMAAGSMLRSTAEDLGNYLIALLNDGMFKGRRLLSPASMKEMWTPQINFPGLTKDKGGDGSDYHYGLGWMISVVEGRQLIHHGGSRGTMSSMTMLYPEQNLAASILLNLDYNYIDRHRFASEFSIINNVFHLLQGEPTSDFGNPRVSDPTLNNYDLPDSSKSKFVGKYRFSGRGDARNFQGAILEVSAVSTGQLEGQLSAGDELRTEFLLDFTNEVSAVSRNLAAPRGIRFQINPDLEVTGLLYGGSEFQKLAADFADEYQWVSPPEASFGFYLPRNWTWEFKAQHLLAQKQQDTGIKLWAGPRNSSDSELEACLRSVYPEQQQLYAGVASTEIRGKNLWRSQSFLTQQSGMKYQHLVLTGETAHFGLILTTPSGKLTKEIQAVVHMLMDSFRN